jgi:tryptophan-rich sensory protein
MDFRNWYDNLAKPAWTPSPQTISQIWMVLYSIILISFGFVFYQSFRGGLPWLIALPFAINLIANVLFMPFFGGMRNLSLALLDIAIVWVTIPWMMLAIWPHDRWVAAVQIPYLVWVSTAALLQVMITFSNRNKSQA